MNTLHQGSQDHKDLKDNRGNKDRRDLKDNGGNKVRLAWQGCKENPGHREYKGCKGHRDLPESLARLSWSLIGIPLPMTDSAMDFGVWARIFRQASTGLSLQPTE